MSDCLIVGGGVVGLSLAYELAGQGRTVQLIDAGQPGQEASWAGAGILPPASPAAADALERLTALSNRLHAAWSEELRRSTGIDNGYRRTGALYLARDDDEADRLESFARQAAARDIRVERLSSDELVELEAAVQPRELRAVYHVPDECQIRNPRHLKALIAACGQRGVRITPGAPAETLDVRGGRLASVRTALGTLSAESVFVTAGAWSSRLAAMLGVEPVIKPIRGQMLLLSTRERVVSRIINEGPRYLVPRDDGRVLVGSTEEDAGFDRSTTAGAQADLLAFALGLVPALAGARVERSWAGLRPATADGVPYLGRVPGVQNAFVAAGHFRGGLQLSTGTAVVMSQLAAGGEAEVDLSSFALDRAASDLPGRALSRRRVVRPH